MTIYRPVWAAVSLLIVAAVGSCTQPQSTPECCHVELNDFAAPEARLTCDTDCDRNCGRSAARCLDDNIIERCVTDVCGCATLVQDTCDNGCVLNACLPDNTCVLSAVTGRYDPDYSAFDIAISGSHAFVTWGEDDLYVVDISTPTDPKTVKRIRTGGFTLMISAVVHDDYLLIAEHGAGLHILDIANPAQTAILGTFRSETARGAAMRGTTAFLADGDDGLKIINASDPRRATLLGAVDTPGHAFGVSVAGDHAYVADRTGGLQVVDIHDVTDPHIVASVFTGQSWAVAIGGDSAYAYVAGNAGLQIVDIRNPSMPTIVASVTTPGSPLDLSIRGNIAYVADGAGVTAIDIGNPLARRVARVQPLPRLTQGIAATDEHVFAASQLAGVQVLDASLIRALPAPATEVELGILGRDLVIADDTAYVVGDDRLQIVDLAAVPPAVVGQLSAPGADAITVTSNYAYVARGPQGIDVVDISVATAPARLATMAGSEGVTAIASRGTRLYFATYDTESGAALQVMNVTDPLDPYLVGAYETPHWIQHIVMENDLMYLAAGGRPGQWISPVLEVVSTANEADLRLLGRYESESANSYQPYVRPKQRLAVRDHIAYLATYASLDVIDISDPSIPMRIGTIDQYVSDVAVANGTLYYADWFRDSGVHVADIDDPRMPMTVGQLARHGTRFAAAGDQLVVLGASRLRVHSLCAGAVQ